LLSETQTIGEESVTEGALDLRSLSDLNYRRHRALRLASASIGGILFIGVVALGVWDTLTSTPLLSVPFRYLLLAGGSVLPAYLLFAIFWVPVKLWAPPPMGLSVDPRGLEFWMGNGRRIRLGWEEAPLEIELLRRAGSTGLPVEASYRLWVTRGNRDYVLAWRRVVPLTYLTAAGFDRILQGARLAQIPVARIDNAKSLSMTRSTTQTAFVISRATAG
jgi:hypothetical protein